MVKVTFVAPSGTTRDAGVGTSAAVVLRKSIFTPPAGAGAPSDTDASIPSPGATFAGDNEIEASPATGAALGAKTTATAPAGMDNPEA